MKKQNTVRKFESKKSRHLALALALTAVAALGSGCGQQAYNEGTVSSDPGTTPTGGTSYPGGGTSTTSTGTSSNPVATTTTSNSSPNYSFHFETTGSGTAVQVGGGSMRVTADSLLKVSVTAGNGEQIGGTGYTMGFNCEQFNIRVGNLTQTAFVRKQGYTDWMLDYGYMSYDPCANAPTTWTYDFSPTLSVGRSQSVAITINGMATDNCHANGYPDDGGCGMTNVTLSNYSVDGFISVTTD